MATIRKLKNGRFKAIIRDRRGNYLLSRTFKRKTDARTWASRQEADRESIEACGERGARLPFALLADRYINAYEGRDTGRPGQVRWWYKRFEQTPLLHITQDAVRDALDDFARGDAQRWDGADERARPKFVSRGHSRSPATVNRMRAALSSIFNFAINERLVSRNPVRGVRSAPENNKRIRYLDDQERRQLLEACRTSRWERLYLLVLMALMTGARQGELLNLHWEAINFSARTATLNHTKNGDRRVITLPPAVIPELMAFRRRNGLIFPGEKRSDRPYTFRKAWHEALRDADVTDFRFHDLRHSAASYLAMGGASLLEIADVLGHRNLETTRRYAHLSVAHKQALTDRLLGGLSDHGGILT